MLDHWSHFYPKYNAKLQTLKLGFQGHNNRRWAQDVLMWDLIWAGGQTDSNLQVNEWKRHQTLPFPQPQGTEKSAPSLPQERRGQKTNNILGGSYGQNQTLKGFLLHVWKAYVSLPLSTLKI